MCGRNGNIIGWLRTRRPGKSDFGLSGGDISLFIYAQWPVPQTLFLVYRVFMACYVMTWLMMSIVNAGNTTGLGGFFVFLTNWSFIVLALYFTIAAIGTAYTVFMRRNRTTANELTMQPKPSDSNANQSVSQPTTVTPCENINKLPVYFKVTWVLLNVCLTAHPIITIIYWGFIYNPEFVYNNQGGAYGVALTVHRHALNTIFAYLDLFVSATPIKFWHFVHPCAYSLLYIAFSLVYFWAGGRNPYDGNPAIYTGILDWTTPARTIPILFGVILTLVMFHSIGYGCYRLRVYIVDRCLNAGDGHRRDSQVLHNQINIECNPNV
ncbi:protein rolling stone-like [Asterias amurensis]|uniref:protein rolling stone-like n=1 Tax=Asterias amurensis TaxID=7602 RepID=UPI003AB7D419